MAHNPHLNSKGTLTSGQQIAVNKYNVTVERFLSQGGFAHVYLVTTPTPVYNTTHHVLKRIAVQNESMLKEVKKEVDIMRLLRGHPNIVFLIDAAWHRMADGSFEVFILMELCPGGGIIDMMNRRLRERLTEAEILTIFADVCEGVACMHNLKPPLLHRDLKVENILQASATSYKLCDFGSATTVAPRPPATTQEIRALEADLNRHTTLQYRAPEMVDPFLRRPVDEKSDVWALGVLLYKLCYYTTPFEEHGPLAILNVQYRIPPYPVYSQQMNALIASMLREHGTSRPSVFELLNVVHGLRGTTSPFKYTIPAPQPLTQALPKSSTLPALRSPAPPVAKSPQTSAAAPARNNGIEAREKVLEAIAPMRRGRPVATSPSVPPPVDVQAPAKSKPPLVDFSTEEDKAWKKATGRLDKDERLENPWDLATTNISTDKSTFSVGFGDNFAEKLWETYDRSTPTSAGTTPVIPPSQSTPEIRTPLLPSRPTQGRLVPKTKSTSPGRHRDAFDGLGLETSRKAAPTLGEARKLRTGLATLGSSGAQNKADSSGWGTSQNLSSKPTPSPRAGYLHPKAASHSQNTTAPSPAPSWRGMASRPNSATMDNAESRFPSLEELDADFTTSGRKLGTQTSVESFQIPHAQPITTQNVKSTRQPLATVPSTAARSQQATGSTKTQMGPPKDPVRREEKLNDAIDSTTHNRLDNSMLASRPSLVRKRTNSTAVKHTPANQSSSAVDTPPSEMGSSKEAAPKLPPRPPATATDWLTGDDDNLELSAARSTPVVRDSPSKRASFIEGSLVALQEPLAAMQGHAAVPVSEPIPAPAAQRPTTPSKHTSPSTPKKHGPGSSKTKVTMTPAESTSSSRAPAPPKSPRKTYDQSSSSSADEGPEDATGSFRRKGKAADHSRHKARQSSVHDLVDLWGGGTASPNKEKFDEPTRNATEKGPVPSSSGALKRRPTNTKPTTKPLLPRSHSPQPVRATDPSRSLDAPSSSLKVDTTNHSKQPSKPSPSPKSAKSRPQSMLVFPTRANTAEPPQVPRGLPVPPENPTGFRNTRRMSISDRVQRYEAIGGLRASNLNGVSPLTPSKSTPQANATAIADAARELKRELLASSAGTSKPVMSPVSHVHATGSRMEGFAGAGGHVMGDYLDKPAMKPSSWQSRPRSPHKETFGVPDKERVEKEPLPPSSPTPTKPTTLNMSDATPPSPAPAPSSNNVFPLRRTGLNLEHLDDSSTPPTQEIRSPSPERPYRGVGKLIDQWQRKAATSNDASSIPPRRGPIIPKRTGLVGGATGGS